VKAVQIFMPFVGDQTGALINARMGLKVDFEIPSATEKLLV
jgi:hypothetical protein